MAIPTRVLGRTGFEVTVLGYGAMELRGLPRGPEVSDEDAERVLNAVLDSGINLIDTSVDYGRSEELIGRFLSARRDEFFLCSKCGCPLSVPPDTPAPYPHDYTAENVRADVEQSLRRLQTDRLDLVQVHMSPTLEDLRDGGTIEELVELREEGKIRFIGMSGTLPELPDHIDMASSTSSRSRTRCSSAAMRGGSRAPVRPVPACSFGAGSAAAPPPRTRAGRSSR